MTPVKVLDFGLAKVAEPEGSSRSENSPTLTLGMTQVGAVLMDVAPDGKRFLMGILPAAPGNAAQGDVKLQMVENWFEELRQKAPGGK